MDIGKINWLLNNTATSRARSDKSDADRDPQREGQKKRQKEEHASKAQAEAVMQILEKEDSISRSTLSLMVVERGEGFVIEVRDSKNKKLRHILGAEILFMLESESAGTPKTRLFDLKA